MENFHFSSYHNRHIKFWLDNGQELCGVIVISDEQEKITNKIYRFISSINMIEHRRAIEVGNIKRMKELEQEIDITKIKSAVFV